MAAKNDVSLSGVGGAGEERCQMRVRGLTGSNEGPGQPLETPLADSQQEPTSASATVLFACPLSALFYALV